MKLTSKSIAILQIIILFAYNSAAYSRNVILISYLRDDQARSVKFIVDTLVNKYNIPKTLVSIKKANIIKIQSSEAAVLHLLLNNQDKLKVLKKNENIIENSFRVFFESKSNDTD